ncbi:MAG: hypothetical protein KGL53_04765, partial [Elusimicrobia bacterium]|nr:hypothetical protein [Elusimicrobiota bacterium]
MLDLIRAPLVDLLGKVLRRAPGFALAFLLLLLGLVAARWLRSAIERGLEKAGLDERTSPVGV